MPATPRLTASRMKARVLAHGVTVTPAAQSYARRVGAKSLQRVYNAPADARPDAPQEILIADPDGFTVCAALVAPIPGREPLVLDTVDERLVLRLSGTVIDTEAAIRYVPRPAYYATVLPSGQPITRVVSSCGATELNVWPWHDCAIGPLCRFCGINQVQRISGNGDLLTARGIGAGNEEALHTWLADLQMAVKAAASDPTYDDELFPMIVSGNLPTPMLDRQAELYAVIAREMVPLLTGRTGSEGIVALTAPPADLALLAVQRDAGIGTMAINLEVYTEDAFRIECPGKDRIGRDVYHSALMASVDVFGHGRAWTNFVLGLEPMESLLVGCRVLASAGVTPGASVLHLDQGATIRSKTPPTFDELVWFYRALADIYREHGLRPYFSSRALRSSLANEAYLGRL